LTSGHEKVGHMPSSFPFRGSKFEF
jgi:hypothetical protein